MEDRTQEPSWPLIGMTTEEAAKSLRVDVKTVQDAIKDGGLPARLVGRGWRISPKALEEWIASGKGEGRRPPQAVDASRLDEALVEKVRRLAAGGASKAQIARDCSISRPLVYKCLRASGPRGTSILEAEADVIVDADGHVVKDRDGIFSDADGEE